MPDEIPMRREGNRLAPVDQMAEELLAKIPADKQVLVTAHLPRNINHHRLAWALATKVAEACDFLHDPEDAMEWLKLKARHVRFVVDHRSGETLIIPKSIRFASVDQQTFSRIFNRMVYVTVTEIIPGLDEGALRSEIEQMVGIAPPAVEPSKPKRKSQRANPEPQQPRTSDNGSGKAITKGGTHTIRAQHDPQGDVGTHGQPSSNGNLAAAGSPPKNAKEWVTYSVRWLTEARDKRIPSTEILARWTNELKLRMECGLTPKERDPVFELFTEIVNDIRKSEAV